jgi:hypothetical protein
MIDDFFPAVVSNLRQSDDSILFCTCLGAQLSGWRVTNVEKLYSRKQWNWSDWNWNEREGHYFFFIDDDMTLVLGLQFCHLVVVGWLVPFLHGSAYLLLLFVSAGCFSWIFARNCSCACSHVVWNCCCCCFRALGSFDDSSRSTFIDKKTFPPNMDIQHGRGLVQRNGQNFKTIKK